MSLLGKKKKPFVGVPTPPGYVPGLSRGESSSWSFLVLISRCPDMARGGLCAGPNSNGDALVCRCCVGCAQCSCVQSGELLVTLNVSRDSSQPFCVGQSGVVGEISSGAVSG